jgi:hypothetical protein
MTTDTLELPARLRVQGRDLIKPNGARVWLRGPNFGAFNDDDEQQCPVVADKGANAIRMALRWWGTWGKGDDPNPDCRDDRAFAFLDRTKFETWLGRLGACAAAGMWSVPFIDSNCGQGGTNSAADVAYCDPYGHFGAAGHNFYTDAGMRKMYAEVVWAAVAARLRVIARIGMLEIHPEPAHHRPSSWKPLVAQVQKACIDAIRAVDPDTPILVGAMPGYSIFRVEEGYLELRELFGGTLPPNLVWTGNLLGGYVTDSQQFDSGLQHLTDLRDKYDACVFVQQVGRDSQDDPTLDLMRHAVSALKEAQVGYTWWEWRQNGAHPDGMGLNYPDPETGQWISKDDEIAVMADNWASAP